MKSQDRYDSLLQYYSMTVEMPWKLLKAQMLQESSANPDAKSRVGAMGLMQFMPRTAKDEFIGSQMDPLDPEESIKAASRYMAKLVTAVRLAVYSGPIIEPDHWKMALASYNGGIGYVQKAIHMCAYEGIPYTWENVLAKLPKVLVKGKRMDVKQVEDYVSRIWKKYEEDSHKTDT